MLREFQDPAVAQVALILAVAFHNEGLPVEWGLAIARQESNFRTGALNMSIADSARGGSWGLCQMSLTTARALGYVGTPQGLTDPTVNARLAAKLCRELARRFGSANLADVASGYNSGKPLAKAPSSTRIVYVPRVLKFADDYRAYAKQIASQLPVSSGATATSDKG